MQYMHTWEYYSATKRDEVLTHVMMVDLRHILISERSQTQKAMCPHESIHRKRPEEANPETGGDWTGGLRGRKNGGVTA